MMSTVMNQCHIMKRLRVEDLAESLQKAKSNSKKAQAKRQPLFVALTYEDPFQP